jgi:arylsulfatase A
MVAYTDKMVGKIVAKIDALGIRDNTLVIFTGDNGTYTGITSQLNGKPYQGGKGSTTDNGTHVPLVASWPGKISAGIVSEDLIDFTDMLPTIAETTGAAHPKGVTLDGRSFLPQLLGKPGNPRQWIYCWYARNGIGKNNKASQHARTVQYKYYLRGDFYDVVADPKEKKSLADGKLTDEQRQIRDQLRQVIQKYDRTNSQRNQQTKKQR